MVEFWNDLLEADSDSITTLQMIVRGIIVFFVGLIVIRIGGKRVFGKSAAFDIVVGIIIGSILSRAITGNAPLIPTVLTALVLVLLHKFLGYLSVIVPGMGNLIKGKEVLLVKDGKIIQDAMKGSGIGEKDLFEALRTEAKTKDLSQFKEAYLERSGEISFVNNTVKKNEKKQID